MTGLKTIVLSTAALALAVELGLSGPGCFGKRGETFNVDYLPRQSNTPSDIAEAAKDTVIVMGADTKETSFSSRTGPPDSAQSEVFTGMANAVDPASKTTDARGDNLSKPHYIEKRDIVQHGFFGTIRHWFVKAEVATRILVVGGIVLVVVGSSLGLGLGFGLQGRDGSAEQNETLVNGTTVDTNGTSDGLFNFSTPSSIFSSTTPVSVPYSTSPSFTLNGTTPIVVFNATTPSSIENATFTTPRPITTDALRTTSDSMFTSMTTSPAPPPYNITYSSADVTNANATTPMEMTSANATTPMEMTSANATTPMEMTSANATIPMEVTNATVLVNGTDNAIGADPIPAPRLVAGG